MRLYYLYTPKVELVEYVDASYLSDPHNGRARMGYLFTCGGL